MFPIVEPTEAGLVLVPRAPDGVELGEHAVGDRPLLGRWARNGRELEKEAKDVAQRAASTTTAPRARARSSAAPTKPRKSGAGRVGRDLNSGWNWLAMNHGWSGSSTISTSRPSWKVPETTRPLPTS